MKEVQLMLYETSSAINILNVMIIERFELLFGLFVSYNVTLTNEN